MKFKFKNQDYQTQAVSAVIECFAGQSLSGTLNYPLAHDHSLPLEQGWGNNALALTKEQLLANICKVQRKQNLPLSDTLIDSKACPINLDIEMETGTGKTYCYIKTILELHKQYGWSKFIITVPSIAIREGVAKSLTITAEHFAEIYGIKPHFFIYNSDRLHEVGHFASQNRLTIMIINMQAFNAKESKRRIYEEQDSFGSRRPIDVLAETRPIIILDEPQRMSGDATLEALKDFNPLMILRYSATHKVNHNKIYRLDALDAYNQKLVKKIAVCGISIKGLPGNSAYLYLEGIQIHANKPPKARIEIDIRRRNSILLKVAIIFLKFLTGLIVIKALSLHKLMRRKIG